MRTDGRIDVIKLIDDFRNFENESKKVQEVDDFKRQTSSPEPYRT